MLTTKDTEALSDDALITRLHDVAAESCTLLADLLALLGEVDVRRLYLHRAYPSLFAYCVAELGLSEFAAYPRILVARLCRRFPAVLEALRAGRLHLAAARLLAPHLTEANCEVLLTEAKGRSKREVEEMVARIAPQASVPDSVRKLPVRQPADTGGETSGLVVASVARVAPSEIAPVQTPAATPASAPTLQRRSQAAVVPLAEDAFKVQFTAPRALRDKLREAQALLGADDVASVMEKALDALLIDIKKRRFALVPTPRKPPLPTVAGAERHIPAAILRAVYLRDEGRCTFEDDSGHRCNETRHLEFDHVQGFARMRQHNVEGVRLLCQAHNRLEAERLYGRDFVVASMRRGKAPSA
ncbi:MAG: HNH endonuclease [Myxococcaceae bacterium]